MLKLGRAQGIAMAAALLASRNISVTEYAPRKIKQSITGKGTASKEQVAAMLQRLLNFKETPEFLDATDGLAVVVCHSFQQESTQAIAGSLILVGMLYKDNKKELNNKKANLVKTKLGLYVINKKFLFCTSKILKTALQQIKAPINKITHDAIDNIVESKAKRKNTPIILTTTPTKN